MPVILRWRFWGKFFAPTPDGVFSYVEGGGREILPKYARKKKKDAQANLDKLIKGYESRIKSLEDDVKRLLGKD